MLHIAQGLKLQAPELLHQVFQGKALLGLNLPQRRGVPPAIVKRADGFRIVVRGRVQPMMAPHVDRSRAGIIPAALLHIMLMRTAKQRLKPCQVPFSSLTRHDIIQLWVAQKE